MWYKPRTSFLIRMKNNNAPSSNRKKGKDGKFSFFGFMVELLEGRARLRYLPHPDLKLADPIDVI